jgi:hypothetical protein
MLRSLYPIFSFPSLKQAMQPILSQKGRVPRGLDIRKLWYLVFDDFMEAKGRSTQAERREGSAVWDSNDVTMLCKIHQLALFLFSAIFPPDLYRWIPRRKGWLIRAKPSTVWAALWQFQWFSVNGNSENISPTSKAKVSDTQAKLWWLESEVEWWSVSQSWVRFSVCYK